MSRFAVDPRIVLPAVVAAACFALRALPRDLGSPPTEAHAVQLPQLHGVVSRAQQVRYELDPDASTVRFLVTDGQRQLLASCSRVEGTLTLGPGAADGALNLHLELASSRRLEQVPATLDVRHVLGVLGDLAIDYRATLHASTAVELRGLHRDLWLGTIHFGPRVVRQPIVLWRDQLPGRPLRTQGHGTVSGEAFGLPDRSWFGLFGEHHEVTLGLDLAWRRVRDR